MDKNFLEGRGVVQLVFLQSMTWERFNWITSKKKVIFCNHTNYCHFLSFPFQIQLIFSLLHTDLKTQFLNTFW